MEQTVRAKTDHVDVVVSSVVDIKSPNATESKYSLRAVFQDNECKIIFKVERELFYDYDPESGETEFFEVENRSRDFVEDATCGNKEDLLDLISDVVEECTIDDPFFYVNEERLLYFARELEERLLSCFISVDR